MALADLERLDREIAELERQAALEEEGEDTPQPVVIEAANNEVVTRRKSTTSAPPPTELDTVHPQPVEDTSPTRVPASHQPPITQHSRKPSEIPSHGRPRGGSQTEMFLESIQYAAQQQVLSGGEHRDMSSVIKATLLFILAMLGESVFVMVRDWLDNTKKRQYTANVDGLEEELEALSEAAVRDLEREHQTKHGTMPSQKQRLHRAKSVKMLAKAKSVRQWSKGLGNTGKADEGESLAKRTLAIRKEMYGDRHLATANALHELAAVQCQKGDYVEAQATFREAIRIIRLACGEGSAREIVATHNLASAMILQAKQCKGNGTVAHDIEREAGRMGKRAIEMSVRKYGDSHVKTQRLKKVWGGGSAM